MPTGRRRRSATWHTVDPDGQCDGVIPGKPSRIARSSSWMIADQLAPIGVPGEICIGGRGLARVSQPVRAPRRSLLWRTLSEQGRACAPATWVPPGRREILFLGESDRQVKVRGHRIELDEIEHRLPTPANQAGRSRGSRRERQWHGPGHVVHDSPLAIESLRTPREKASGLHDPGMLELSPCLSCPMGK